MPSRKTYCQELRATHAHAMWNERTIWNQCVQGDSSRKMAAAGWGLSRRCDNKFRVSSGTYLRKDRCRGWISSGWASLADERTSCEHDAKNWKKKWLFYNREWDWKNCPFWQNMWQIWATTIQRSTYQCFYKLHNVENRSGICSTSIWGSLAGEPSKCGVIQHWTEQDCQWNCWMGCHQILTQSFSVIMAQTIQQEG